MVKNLLRKINEQKMSDKDRQSLMKKTSPKYVPREWMLYHAYKAAEKKILPYSMNYTIYSKNLMTSNQNMNRNTIL
eukprot:UN08992